MTCSLFFILDNAERCSCSPEKARVPNYASDCHAKSNSSILEMHVNSIAIMPPFLMDFFAIHFACLMTKSCEKLYILLFLWFFLINLHRSFIFKEVCMKILALLFLLDLKMIHFRVFIKHISWWKHHCVSLKVCKVN